MTLAHAPHPQDDRHPQHPNGSDPEYLRELLAKAQTPWAPGTERGRLSTVHWLESRLEYLAAHPDSP